MNHALIDAPATLKTMYAPRETCWLKETIGYFQAKVSQQERDDAPDGENQKDRHRHTQEKNLHESAFELDGPSFPKHFSAQEANGNRVDKHREKHEQRQGIE